MNFVENILNLIFPPVCGFCGKFHNDFLCDECKRKFDEIKISNVEDYSSLPVYFEEHYYLLKYEDFVRDFILKYKFDEMSYLYKSFARIIAYDEKFRKQFIDKYDCIISVPVHKKRFKTRGYNQSKLIAEEVARICGKRYYDEVLVKCKNIVAQSTLDKLGRVGNIKGAFSAGDNSCDIKGKNVALFDDIFTTGATTNECAKVLKQVGAESVGIFTLAKD